MSYTRDEQKEIILRSIGKRIQEYRQRIGLSQEQVAERAGISQNHVSRLEQGTHDPHFYTILQVAKVLNIPLDGLVSDFSEENINIFLQNIKDDVENMSQNQLDMLKDAIGIIKKYKF